MALIKTTRILNSTATGGLFIIDGQPIGWDPGLPEIPPIAQLMPRTRRWRNVKPCGTLAAWRRHQRRGEPQDAACLARRARWLRQQRRRRSRRAG